MIHSFINKQFIDQIPGFYGILNLESKFEVVNKTGAEWTGFESEEKMRGLSYADCRCRSSEDAEVFLQHDALVKKKGHIRFLGYYCYADNNWKIILGEKYLLRNEANQLIGIVSHFNDFSQNNLIDLNRFLINSRKKISKKKSDNQFIYLLDDNNLDTQLSISQTECLFFLIRGKTIKQIAKILNLSPRTVEEYLNQVQIKLNCNTKLELVDKAITEGYINIVPTRLLNKIGELNSTHLISAGTNFSGQEIQGVYLSKRQISVLRLLVRGQSSKGIAQALGLSFRTVQHYIEKIKIKLNVYSRSELINLVIDYFV